MAYNFDEIVDRRNSDSLKWNSEDDLSMIPMWVADMDFKTCPDISQALISKAAAGIYGYGIVPVVFFQSIIDWYSLRHHFDVKREWLQPTCGMIPAISAVIRTLVKPGESILLQPPVYNHFFTLIERCGCQVVSNNLLYSKGNYTIDFEDLELKASDPKVKLMLLCNPHNPIGRVWSITELESIAAICARNGVVVVADEIHADLVLGGRSHIVFEQVAQHYRLLSFTCSSPGKSFNLSSLAVSYIICRNIDQLKNVEQLLQMQETESISPFGAEALITAYTKGEKWLEELKLYLHGNYQFLVDYCKLNLPAIRISPLEGTYLAWLDCSYLGLNSYTLCEILVNQAKIRVNPGSLYGPAGDGFLRMNIALPRKLLEQALQQFSNQLKLIEQC